MSAEREGQLEFIIKETLWMARRYAHKRNTFAPATVNECIDLAKKLGIKIDEDRMLGANKKTMYADDGMLGEWDPETGRFIGE